MSSNASSNAYASGGLATPIMTLPFLMMVANTDRRVASVLEKSPDNSVPSDSTISPLGSLNPVPHTLLLFAGVWFQTRKNQLVVKHNKTLMLTHKPLS